MTFGEKIQKLRKDAGLSQEELSDQLGVSRQAISKWERDNGYPETEKIVRMSKIFHVTLDYLLQEADIPASEATAEQGIYVSREMADGFLLYQKRKFLKIALAVGIMVGSLALSFVFSHVAMLAFMLMLILGIVFLCAARLTDDPYQKLRREPLLFDRAVKGELHAAYAEKKKFLHMCLLLGIALILLGVLFFPLIVPAEFELADALVLAAGMLLAGVGTFLCIYMSGILRAYRLLLTQEAYPQKRR